ncbi:MAG: hypothetical protein LBJ08_07920, partial [Bifidobacteriaceae bacterium]|nr:hypothetical protein [Bifidobacteriaceae bacterium]
ALILACAAIGMGLAAVVTPLVRTRVTPEAWVVTCASFGALGQCAIAFTYALPVLLPAALVLSLGIQGGKIAVDTIVQRDVADSFRGRAFALYDFAFNAAFLVAAAIAALCLPLNGYSRPLFVALAVAYGVIAVAFGGAIRAGESPPS